MKLRESLFWDTDPAKIDLVKNAQYVIERVLDFGRDEEVRWPWNQSYQGIFCERGTICD